MVFNDRLADEFCALHASFIDDNFVMLSELYLVILYGLIKVLILIAALFDVMDDLEQVDRH